MNWYFGLRAGIWFGEDSVITTKLDGATNNSGGAASISDVNGNLLFYTDGDSVYNRNHLVMPNGFNLKGASLNSFQPTVIVPQPALNNLYYVFCTNPGTAIGFSYSIVDLSLNGGLGDVTVKTKTILPNPAAVLTAVKHANGTDVWVISHERNTNRFAAFLVTASGVIETPVFSAVGPLHGEIVLKQMKASPDGSKIAATSADLTTRGDDNVLEAYNFNPSSGKLGRRLLHVSHYGANELYHLRSPSGIEFSADSRFLYTTNNDNVAYIYQFDMSSGLEAEIYTSIQLVGVSDYKLEHQMQLGADGKIYMAAGGGGHWEYLSRIENPNLAGKECSYKYNAISLRGRQNIISLPAFIQSYFVQPAYIGVSPICILDPVQFTGNSLGSYDSLRWNFDDPNSGIQNTSTKPNPVHTFSSTGKYNVTLTTYLSGIPLKQLSKSIELKPLPFPELGPDKEICQGQIIELKAPEEYHYEWSTGSSESFITVTASGLYKLKMDNGQCASADSIAITVYEQPVIDLPSVINTCDKSVTLNAGNEKFSKLWSTGQQIDKIEVAAPGTYSVTIVNKVCIAQDTVEVKYRGITDLKASAIIDSIGLEEQVSFSAEATDIKEWNWDFADGTLSTEQYAQHAFREEGLFPVKVNATNSFGCSSLVQVDVNVKPYVFIPNVFTPNNDGKNDEFKVLYNGSDRYELKVFNRWEHQVFSSNSKEKSWNGSNEDSGVFFYYLKAGGDAYRGWVQLVK